MQYRILVPALILSAVLFSCWEGDYSRIADTFRLLKGKREVTVVVVGDSVTGSTAPGAGDSFASRLKPKFAEFLGSRISLINSSRPNQTYDQARRFYQEDILSFRPDVVIIMLGLVDSSQEQMYLTMFEEATSLYFDLLRKEETLVIVLTPPGYKERDRTGGYQERLDEFNEELIRQARFRHFPVIDIARHMGILWSDNPEQYRRMFSDMVHLSNEGSEFVADYIMNTIRQTVERAGGN
ncbi:MAG: SGNH/GDSL hydrolase family protein [Candidatus Latescibacterota bacterium]